MNDAIDPCPLSPNLIDYDGDGCSDSEDWDDDNDSVPDYDDECPKGIIGLHVADLDSDGCSDVEDLDIDGDGLSNLQEDQIGTDSRNPDSDYDSYKDGFDAFPLDPLEWADTDGDGMMDGDEVSQSFDPTDPASRYVEPQDYGFIEIHVFPAEYTFGDEPIARTNTTSWNSGAYTIELPVGSYKIKAFSHQSTYQSEFHSDVLTWEAATPVTITADATQTIDFELGAAPSGTVTGLLKDTSDATADIGWPEITLHDPTDEDVMYWPGQFDRDWNESTQSHNDIYSMVAPTGSYKVKIHFWDGAYITSYFKDNGDGTYGTTSFDDAATISITKAHTTGSPLANINFDLAGAPTGIIKGKVVDKDTGVFSGDWYSVILRGANEEWGEWTVSYTHLTLPTKRIV